MKQPMLVGAPPAVEPGAARRSAWRRAYWGCLGTAAVVGGVLTLIPGIWSVLGWMLLLPVSALVLLGGATWLWGRLVWKVRRRLFVSFLVIGVAPLAMSMVLTILVEVFYWFLFTASVVSLSLDDVGSDVAVIADATADAARGKGAAIVPADLPSLVPGTARYPGLRAHLVDPRHPLDPLRPGTDAPAWMLSDSALDGMFLLPEPGVGEAHIVFASIRELAPGGHRLLVTLTLDPELAAGLHARTGISVFTPTVFIPDGEPPTGINVVSPGEADDGPPEPGTVRAVVSDDADDELSRALGLVPKGFRYGWLVTHPVSRWEDAQPGTCLLLFFSALASDLKRLEGTYSGLLGQVLVTMVPAVMSVFIVLYLGCLAIGVFIAGAISGGIGRLYQATLEFSRGNMDHRIRYRSRDQLGELARSMNDMAGNIQRLLRESAERERLAQEFFLAQEVQRKLLPAPLPPFRGAEVAGSLRPMSEVGGDTYDWRTISDRELLVMVADVSGHGLRPGLLAAMAKASLSAKLSHTHEHPEIMQALHELTLGALDRRLFMTLCLATFDLAGGRLQISSAGHPPCLRYREGAVTEILEESFPLGVRQARTFVPRDLDLRPGDVYLFISDGLVEGRDRKGAVWGYDRLAASLLEHAPKPTADIVASIQADHDRFCGDTSQGDDITLVVVAYRPGPEAAG